MAGGLGGGDKLVLINPLANPPTSLPVKIMRLDGKLMGQLVPDTTVVTSTTYTAAEAEGHVLRTAATRWQPQADSQQCHVNRVWYR